MGLRDADTGVWSGELASSALSTALAAIALAGEDEAHNRLAADGAAWLVAHANPDGGQHEPDQPCRPACVGAARFD